MKHSYRIARLFSLFFALLLSVAVVSAKDFVLVIDAGHGGRDAGALGNRAKEKDINLGVALKLGRMVTNKVPGVKVVYTRDKDVYLTLQERANKANRVEGDLFISIHTNSIDKKSPNRKTVAGASTWTLGLHRSKENLEVAKRENSVIYLEDDFSTRYEGFDPNSTESYIIFELMQNKHMEQSISLASDIQNAFSSSGRVDRGVRQAGFLVLRETSMPSVLVELGYISNRNEERFMSSSKGQEVLAEALYRAFANYKRNFDLRSGYAAKPVSSSAGEVKPVERKVEASKPSGETVYKVQFLTADEPLPKNSRRLKGYKDAEYYVENGICKYTYGSTTSLEEIKRIRRSMLKDFKDAFIVSFKDGKRVR